MKLYEIIEWISDRAEALKTEEHTKDYYIFLLQDIIVRLVMVDELK